MNKQEGVKRLATETGAGQWGSALACACRLMGLECMVYMVRVSYDAKPYRRIMMKTYGAEVVASPSHAHRGRPEHPGAGPGFARQPGHRHLRGGRGRAEARRHQVRPRQRAQPRAAAPDHHRPGGEEADGARRRLSRHHHRLPRRRQQLRRPRLSVPAGQAQRAPGRPCGSIAVEPASCPSLTQGQAGVRLRRHGGHHAADDDAHAGPQLRAAAGARRRPALPRLGAAGQPPAGRRASSRPRPTTRREVFESAVDFAQCEGTIPAPESAHAIHSAIRHALAAREAGEKKAILFNLSRPRHLRHGGLRGVPGREDGRVGGTHLNARAIHHRRSPEAAAYLRLLRYSSLLRSALTTSDSVHLSRMM